MHSPKIQNFVP